MQDTDDPNQAGVRLNLLDQPTQPQLRAIVDLGPVSEDTLRRSQQLAAFVPTLWETEVQRALRQHLAPWAFVPPRSLTRAERTERAWRRLWLRIRDLWPLQWKDRYEED